jgi:transposase
LARPSAALRSLAKRVPLVSHLDERGYLRPHLGATPGSAERARASRSRHLVCRRHKRQGLPSCGRSEKGGCEALSRSRGGFSTKVHLVCDGLGNPLTAILTPGQQHESTVCTELLANVRVQTSAAGGRPRSRPKLVVADRGYDASAFRRYLRRCGIRCVIPEKRVPMGKRRRRRGRPPTFCEATYRRRNVDERLVGWLKEHRQIATLDKLASSFLAMVKCRSSGATSARWGGLRAVRRRERLFWTWASERPVRSQNSGCANPRLCR